MKISYLALLFAGLLFGGGCIGPAQRKDPITIYEPRIEAKTGLVTIIGVDPNRPQRPFTWNWGDGHTEIGWFPLAHIYQDTKRDYTLTITAYYEDGQTGQERAEIGFLKKYPITIYAPRIQTKTGLVLVNGVDLNRPQKQFLWNWGDGSTETAWFPLAHIYQDTKRDYTLTITAYYENGQTGQAHAEIGFLKNGLNQTPEPPPAAATPRAAPATRQP
jgi:hypothetical protein